MFESWLANCPGLKVISCIDPADTKGLMKSAIRDNDPVCFMESESFYGFKGDVPEGEYLVPIGKAAIRREGTDVTIVSFNKMMEVVKKAAEELAKEGISAEVIDLRTIRPMDYETIIRSVQKQIDLWSLMNPGHSPVFLQKLPMLFRSMHSITSMLL